MKIISLLQIIVSVVVIGLILLQERGQEASGLFGAGGGDTSGGFYQRRRGFERILFISTIVLVIVFAVLALANLLLV